MGFPKYMYHPVSGTRFITTQAQQDALGAEWHESAGDFANNKLGQNLTAVNDASTPLFGDDVKQSPNLTYYIEWSAACTAGKIAVESAHDPLYAGAWSPVVCVGYGDENASGGTVTANCVTQVSVSGLHAATRCRVIEPVENGFVNVYVLTK